MMKGAIITSLTAILAEERRQRKADPGKMKNSNWRMKREEI